MTFLILALTRFIDVLDVGKAKESVVTGESMDTSS